ncbi:MAG: hypothetical protein IT350_04990 [Deltaproteobacteria bacterium]|nr:hypothetical protein [Deltaproteobacteria bacterium]
MQKQAGACMRVSIRISFIIFFVAMAAAFTACSEKSAPSEAEPAVATPSPAKADEFVDPDEAVSKCMDAFEHLFGPQGCVPGLVPTERAQVACEGYAAWAERGETCGSGALGGFYACLNAIGCDKLEKDEDTELAEYPLEYDKCTEQFARDMNECIDERGEKTK